MIHLIQRGLMFGNLIHIASPALIERYNRALKHLTNQQTKLSEFHIDVSGYSPEIGDELDDHLYLNHAGVNRQFILLTTDQKTAPLLNAKFSTSREILKEFILKNEPQLFALTARDAVAGELVNSVYAVDSPARLFDIRKVKIEADTTSGTVAEAQALADDVDRFMREEDAWFDDVLIADMISKAKRTGDVTRNHPPVLKRCQNIQKPKVFAANPFVSPRRLLLIHHAVAHLVGQPRPYERRANMAIVVFEKPHAVVVDRRHKKARQRLRRIAFVQ